MYPYHDNGMKDNTLSGARAGVKSGRAPPPSPTTVRGFKGWRDSTWIRAKKKQKCVCSTPRNEEVPYAYAYT